MNLGKQPARHVGRRRPGAPARHVGRRRPGVWASACARRRPWGRGRVPGGVRGAPRRWHQQPRGLRLAGAGGPGWGSSWGHRSVTGQPLGGENGAQEGGACGERVSTRAWRPACPLPQRKLRTRWGKAFEKSPSPHPGLPWGPALKNLPSGAGDVGSISYQGTDGPRASEQPSPQGTGTQPKHRPRVSQLRLDAAKHKQKDEHTRKERG